MAATRKTKTDRYLATFFEEKGLDLEETFEITSRNGTQNLMNYGVVVEAIKKTSEAEKVSISNTLRAIDFKNGDVRHFLRHLAGALAQDL